MTKTHWILIIVAVLAVVIFLVWKNNKKKAEEAALVAAQTPTEQAPARGKFIDFIGQLLPVAVDTLQQQKAKKDAAAAAAALNKQSETKAFSTLMSLGVF